MVIDVVVRVTGILVVMDVAVVVVTLVVVDETVVSVPVVTATSRKLEAKSWFWVPFTVTR
jgi:hypothetical protein